MAPMIALGGLSWIRIGPSQFVAWSASRTASVHGLDLALWTFAMARLWAETRHTTLENAL